MLFPEFLYLNSGTNSGANSGIKNIPENVFRNSGGFFEKEFRKFRRIVTYDIVVNLTIY